MADKQKSCGCGCALKQDNTKGAKDNKEAKETKESK